MQQALSVVREEHRALGAVLDALYHICRDLKERQQRPDFVLLWAMLTYISRFPERVHHPKEDAFLFRLLRLRDPHCGALIERLEAQHREGALAIEGLLQLLADFQENTADGPGDFCAAVERFCEFQWKHMRLEEEEVFSAAEKHLTEADWQSIETAFAANDDPLLNVESRKDFDELFRKIVNLAPPPYGLGPSEGPGPGRPH